MTETPDDIMNEIKAKIEEIKERQETLKVSIEKNSHRITKLQEMLKERDIKALAEKQEWKSKISRIIDLDEELVHIHFIKSIENDIALVKTTIGNGHVIVERDDTSTFLFYDKTRKKKYEKNL